jgi:hypothetical protein
MRRQVKVVKLGKLNRFLKRDLDEFIGSHTQEDVKNEFHG